ERAGGVLEAADAVDASALATSSGAGGRSEEATPSRLVTAEKGAVEGGLRDTAKNPSPALTRTKRDPRSQARGRRRCWESARAPAKFPSVAATSTSTWTSVTGARSAGPVSSRRGPGAHELRDGGLVGAKTTRPDPKGWMARPNSSTVAQRSS